MKLVLITTSFLMIGVNAYDKVGVQRFCNVDPSEFTAQCNYESLDACRAYMDSGEQCVPNKDFRASPIVSTMDDAPTTSLLKTWQANQATDTWPHRVQNVYRKIHDHFMSWRSALHSRRA